MPENSSIETRSSTGCGCLGSVAAGGVVALIGGFIWSMATGREGIIPGLWPLLGGATGFVIFLFYILSLQREEKTKQKKQRQDNKARCEAEARALLRIKEQVAKLLTSLPPLLDSVALHCTRAAEYFSEQNSGAFWDEMEQASVRLSQYESGLRLAAEYTRSHEERLVALPESYHHDRIVAYQVPDSSTVRGAVNSLLFQARKDTSWDQVYMQRKQYHEQRRGNEILERGFVYLGDRIETSITSAMQSVADSLHISVNNVTAEYSSQLGHHFESFVEQHHADAQARRKFEETIEARATEAVQLIQRRIT